jgi:eukaryotic-like serine/threonine-protein kinase
MAARASAESTAGNDDVDLEGTAVQDEAARDRARAISLSGGHPPTTLPGYRILRQIGEGKYGTVWLARELNTGKHVAIKFYTHRRGVDWSLLGREVEKLAVLYTSRNIVGLLSVGWDHDPPYYVMEYLPNGSLATRLEHGTLPTVEAVRVATRVCQALVHAHGSGILHCDLKPANVLLDQDQEPRLCDFGQSRLADEQGHALGTLFYMAPEQADLKGVPDARWDVYALGALLYHMLVGQPPYRTEEGERLLKNAGSLEDRLAAYRKIVRQSARPNGYRQIARVDAGLAEIIDRCLSVDPARRFANAQAVLDRLRIRAQSRARRPILAIGLILPIVLLAGLAPVALAAMRDAVSTARENVTTRALDSNALSVSLLADSLRQELERRLVELSAIADDEQLREAVEKEIGNPPDQREALWALLDQRRGIMVTKLMQEDRPKDVSWFLCDADGYQRWRNPRSMSQEKNYNYRDYFHGLDTEFVADAAPEGIKPLKKPHISLPYRSTSNEQYSIALSAPVRDRDNQKVIAVLARTLDLSDLLKDYENTLTEHGVGLSGRKLALIDSREWKLLAHPWLKQHADQLTVAQFDQLTLPKLMQYQLAEMLRVSQKASESQAAVDRLDRSDDYIDPIGKLSSDKYEGVGEYGGGWLAAFSAVGNTHWIAIVQEDRDAAWKPVDGLRSRLLMSGIAGLAVVGVLLMGMWGLIVCLLNDWGPRWLRRLAGRGRTELAGSTLLSLSTKGSESD